MSLRQTRRDENAEIAAAASQWLARKRDTARTLDDERAFRAWYDGDVRHAAAYEAMRQTLADVASLQELASLEPLPSQRRMGWRPLQLAAGGVLAAAVAGLAVFATPMLTANDPIAPQTTQLAQVRAVRLPDGSTVTLGAASSIDVRFTTKERRVVLSGGQAFFDVVHNPQRPFVVEAGSAIIRDVGTTFDVNRSDGRVRVSVASGIVEVSGPPAGLLLQRPDPVILRAGVRVEVPDRIEIAAPVELPTLSRAIAPDAWRDGRFVYDDVRLGDLVSDLNRYYAPGVRIADPALAEFVWPLHSVLIK